MVSLPMLEPVIVWLLVPAVILKLDIDVWALKVWSAVFKPVTVTVSLASPPLTTTLPLPVKMAMPLSTALPVFTVRLPVRSVALMLPTILFTTCCAAPLRVSSVPLPLTLLEFSGMDAASILRVSVLLEPVTLIPPLPVVINAWSSKMLA